MSGGTSLGTLLVQRLDAVLGHAVASHPHMVSGLRRDAVTGPGAAQRPPATEDSQRKPTPAEDAATLLKPAAAPQARLAAVIRTPLPSSDPHALPDTVDSPDEADSIDEERPRQTVARGRDARAATTVDGSIRTPQSLPGGTPSAPTVLGQTARLINTLLADPKLDGQTLRGAEPLMESAGGAKSPAQMAAHLKHTIETSGLFYERHLAELAFGRRDIHQLRAEPQARWTAAHARASGSAKVATGHSGIGVGIGSSTNGEAATVSSSGVSSTATPRAETPASQTNAPPAALPPSQDALLRLQLEALATQELRWRGEAWDGAPMDWRISGDEAGEPQDDARPWRSTLTLTLPRLGVVEIALSGTGQQLSVRMQADNAAAELNEQKKTLAARLRASGLSADIAVTNAIATDDTERA